VRIALKGFTKEWEVFVKCVVVVSIFQIRADCGTISLRRRSGKDLSVVDNKHMELMRMLLLLQRARRKDVSGGLRVKSDVTVVTSWGTLLLTVLRGRRRRRNQRGLRQLLQQPWRTLLPSMTGNFLWLP
jgi:hypothetical protein